MTMAASISVRQIKAIHALVRRLGWDDDMYRVMLRERYQVATCKGLSHARAALLIEELKAKVAPPPQPSPSVGRGELSPARPVAEKRRHTWPTPITPTRPLPPRGGGLGRGGTITPKQQALIDALFARLGWDQRRRDGFCRKVIGKPWPQSNGEVTRLLNLLRAMGQRYPGGYDRAQREG